MQVYAPRELYCPSRKELFETAPQPLAPPGGEGAVYLIPTHPNIVAKVFNEPGAHDRRAKVEALIAHPLHGHGRFRFAAPQDILLDRAGGRFVGYTMPHITNARALDEYFDPKSRRFRDDPARVQLAIAVAELVCEAHRHELEITLGDLKPQNLLADDLGRVALIDIDSAQLTTVRGVTYLSPVRSEFYTPPEVYGMDLCQERREQTVDLFALGVILFQLIMRGWHPFSAVGDPDVVARVMHGAYPHAGSPDRPPPGAPALPEELRPIFTQTFVDGHWDAGARPTADEWVRMLKKNEKTLSRRPQDLSPPAAPGQHRRGLRHVAVAVAATTLVAVAPDFLPAAWQGLVTSLASRTAPAPDDAAAIYQPPLFDPTDDLRVPRWDSRRRAETPAYWRRLRDGGGAPLCFESSFVGREP
jgi:DNA-binding helix-hairpin-helix protein with protein kinase domain